MSTTSVLIVEDEWIVSEELKEVLNKNNYEVVGQAEDAFSALDLFITHNPDYVLLDVHIKGDTDGIELASKIRKHGNPKLVFLTAFNDKKLIDRAKKQDPIAYLVKPFDERNLLAALRLGSNEQSENGNGDHFKISDAVFIREKSRFNKIPFDDILYMEAVGSYSDIITKTSKHTLAVNLKNVESKIESDQFLRVHRSFLINMKHVSAYEGNSIYVDQHIIPISNSHKEEFLARLNII